MLQTKSNSHKIINRGLSFPTMNMSGHKQMATDLILLKKVMDSSDISLAIRFYHWEGFCLSIGKNQKHLPKNWLELVRKRTIKIVRRPSGGNAVLHGGGLTYSLVWFSPPRKRHEAYYQANQWIIKAFTDLGVPLHFGNQLTNPLEANCFATSTNADLIDPEGHKRIGSAQLWSKGHLLQHGEILLDPPSQLWTEIFKTKAPKSASICIPRKGLEKILHKACRKYWSELHWEDDVFTKKELDTVNLEANKYSLNII